MLTCPICHTQNPVNVDQCTQCEQDLTLLKIVKNRAFSHFNEGVEHAERGRYQEAKKDLLVALELDSSEPSFFLVLGSVCAHLGELEEAKKYWEQGMDTDPKYKNIHENLVKHNHYPLLKKLRYLGRVSSIITIISLIALIAILSGYLVISKNYRYFNARLNDLYQAEIPITTDYKHNGLNKLAQRINDSYLNLHQQTLEYMVAVDSDVPEILEEWEYLVSKFDHQLTDDLQQELLLKTELYLAQLFHHDSYEHFQTSFEEVKNRFYQLAPEFWDEKEEAFASQHITRLIQTLEKESPLEIQQLAEHLEKIDDYALQYPDERWTDLQEALLNDWLNKEERRILEMIDEEKYEEAYTVFSAMQFMEKYLASLQKEKYLDIKSRINEEYQAVVWSEILDHYSKRRWEEVYTAAHLLFDCFEGYLDEEQQERLEEMYQTAQNRLRWNYWVELESLHNVIIREQITEEQAADIISKAEIIFYEELPGRLFFIMDNVLLYRGMAYIYLHDYEKAREDLQQVLEMDHSPYRGFARQKLEEISQ